MSEVAYVSIGSNIDRERHVPAGVRALRLRFGELTVSRVYESDAEGFDGAPFFNLAAAFRTAEPLADILAALREIEDRAGRDRTKAKFSSRTLDVDLLLLGSRVLSTPELTLPRPDVETSAFVLKPLADIAGDVRHPVTGTRLADMWLALARSGSQQHLRPVECALEFEAA